jgi:hypothetical protein
MSIRSEHYRDTKMVQWLEEHVGKMCEKKSGESWYGDGWQIKNEIIKSVSEEFSIEFDPHVVIEKELSEELQTDFLLRFS